VSRVQNQRLGTGVMYSKMYTGKFLDFIVGNRLKFVQLHCERLDLVRNVQLQYIG